MTRQVSAIPGVGDGRVIIALLALSTLAIWGIAGTTRSLWLDEFHVLNHVRKPDVVQFLHSLREDNHPPLPLFLIRVSRAALGEDPVVLRLPSLLAGALLLLVMGRFLRDHSAFGPPWVTLALILASPGLLAVMSEARMYSWSVLAATGLWITSYSCIEKGRSAWPAALWVAVALHSHYFAFYYLGGIAFTAIVVGRRRPRRLVRLLLSLLVGALSFIPWLRFGFLHQLDNGMAPGQALTTLTDLAGIMLHLVFVGVGSGGGVIRILVYLACPVVVVIVGSGIMRLLPRGALTRGPGPWLVTVGLLVPIAAWVMAVVFPRFGYGWRYVVPSTVPVLLLTAAGARIPLTRLLLALVWMSMLMLTLLVLRTPIREDNEAAVRFILKTAKPSDLVLIDSTWCAGSGFRTIVWDYYAERLEHLRPAHLRIALLRAHSGLLDAPTIFVFTRFPMSNYRANEVLRSEFPPPERHHFGPDRTVLVYRP